MREFNKIFVIALPRCATVSMCDALGLLGVPTAHLGKIYGEQTSEHNNPQRLMRMYEQISAGDYQLDVLRDCRGLADYPACCSEVFPRLDQQYPGSLFINVRRDGDTERWLQSVERQFVGLQLVKQGRQATEEEQRFMKVMLAFREMTFGQSKFDADAYLRAYQKFQAKVGEYFAQRRECLLDIAEIGELQTNGFQRLAEFLQCEALDRPFPNSNQHSVNPQFAFMQALVEGRITSQTGIHPEIQMASLSPKNS
jgi:hypothetical protein